MPNLLAEPAAPENGHGTLTFSGSAGNDEALLTLIDIRLLEAFRAVVDHRTITVAAPSLGLTQPAVSAQIARLKQGLGFSLFERGNGRLDLMPEGLPFYAEASKALTGIDRLTQ